MTKLRFDDIEIIDPPLGELSKKPSLFKSGCLGGCGCFVLLIIGLLVGWWGILGSGPKKGIDILSDFPTSIPLYDRDAIEQVTRIPGKYKGRREILATTLPKIIMGSFAKPHSPSSTPELLTQLWKNLNADSEIPDIITVEWPSPAVNSSFMSSYYKKELTQNGYTISHEISGQGIEQFSFSNKLGVQGTFSAEPLTPENTEGTYVIIEVFVKK